MTLNAPSLLARRPLADLGPRSRAYGRRLAAAQAQAEANAARGDPERADRLALPHRRGRLRARRADARRRPARRDPGHREGLAEPHLPLARRHAHDGLARQALTQGPQVIGADKLWGANLATAGQGMKIGDHRRRHRRRARVLRPGRLHVSRRASRRAQTKDTTPKVIVQRAFAPPVADLRVRDGAVRPVAERLVPRHARRRDRGRRPQHAGRRALPLRRRARRLPRQLQGADDPDARLRPRRQLGRRSPRRSRRPSPTG